MPTPLPAKIKILVFEHGQKSGDTRRSGSLAQNEMAFIAAAGRMFIVATRGRTI